MAGRETDGACMGRQVYVDSILDRSERGDVSSLKVPLHALVSASKCTLTAT
jgi:hypothetical protein